MHPSGPDLAVAFCLFPLLRVGALFSSRRDVVARRCRRLGRGGPLQLSRVIQVVLGGLERRYLLFDKCLDGIGQQGG